MTVTTKNWRMLPLWEHQTKAIEKVEAYLSSSSSGAALVRMPTGTGKTGVIAVLARCIPKVHDVLIVTPWAPLREQMEDDVRERFWKHIKADASAWPKEFRKLMPSTAEARLKETKTQSTIFICTIPALQAMQVNWRSAYSLLKNRIDLVLVDEGHREPAPKWAEAVRYLECPTVLLSATPYRNDHKLFEIDRNFIFAYPHSEAVDDRYIREVRFHERRIGQSPEEFVKSLLRFYRGEFQRIKPDSVSEHKVIVRCETDGQVTNIASLLQDAGYGVDLPPRN